MDKLLEQIEQCLYDLKHNSNHPLKYEVREAIREVELALQNLIQIVNKFQGENNDGSRDTATR